MKWVQCITDCAMKHSYHCIFQKILISLKYFQYNKNYQYSFTKIINTTPYKSLFKDEIVQVYMGADG